MFSAMLLRTAVIASLGVFEVESGIRHHHHKHHHRRHGQLFHARHRAAGALAIRDVAAETRRSGANVSRTPAEADDESAIVRKMRNLENELAKKELSRGGLAQKGKIKVNGPLPADFSERFEQAAAQAVSCDPAEIRVTESFPLNHQGTLVELVFDAPLDIARAIEEQAGTANSKLTNSKLHNFLVQRNLTVRGLTPDKSREKPKEAHPQLSLATASISSPLEGSSENIDIDVDTEMPYGELEPFGREDTAQELTESSIKESDEMVDQLERAEVAEEKRAVFRALTRLRGAAITSFDGVARSQTGNIDEYNKVHQWRNTHPLRHLADEESDVSKWAFPDTADF